MRLPLLRRFPTPLIFLLALGVALAACDSGTTPGGEDDTDIDVPNVYAFESRFEDGASAVAYPGQVTRNLLTTDLKIQIDQLAAEGAESVNESDFLARYEYDDADLSILRPTDPAPVQEQYNDIATGKSLSGKATASYSDQELIGSEALPGRETPATADALIRSYFQRIAANSQDGEQLGTSAVYTTPEGINMSQMVNKLLLGAVVYSQGTAKYLSDDILTNAGNDGPRQEGEPFSELGHVWDEAYGYFGAARTFADFTNEEAHQNIYRDVDGDGQIDFESEYNFTYATYAAERSADAGVDFAQTAFDAFLKGRTAIVNERPIEDILEHRNTARQAWEKVVAANVVHYANSMLGDLEELTDQERTEKNNDELNEHWAEAKAFAWVLQYNPARALSTQQLETLHMHLGATPPYDKSQSEAEEDINQAKQLLQEAYGFSDENMSAW